jgi:hypothetical protein
MQFGSQMPRIEKPQKRAISVRAARNFFDSWRQSSAGRGLRANSHRAPEIFE